MNLFVLLFSNLNDSKIRFIIHAQLQRCNLNCCMYNSYEVLREKLIRQTYAEQNEMNIISQETVVYFNTHNHSPPVF